jgi:signal transduction histidine kinase
MQRIYLVLSAFILIILGVNFYSCIKIFRQQINYQENMLMNQTGMCGRQIELAFSGFINELNAVLDDDDLSDFFSDPETSPTHIKRIEPFYSRNSGILASISLYDGRRNVYHVFNDQGNNRITDIYISREQRHLHADQHVETGNGELVLTVPILRDDSIAANIVLRIDVAGYIETVFALYQTDNTLRQWLVDENGEIILATPGRDFTIADDFTTLAGILPGYDSPGSAVHKHKGDGSPADLISAWYPLRLPHQDLIIVFSMVSGIQAAGAIKNMIILSGATFFVLVLIIAAALYLLGNERRKRIKSAGSEKGVRKILELLPVGIMMKAGDGRLSMINSTALNILKIDDAGKVLGKDISNLFFLFRGHSGKEAKGQNDTSEFVYYDTDREEEVILYKKEIPVNFSGEDVIIETFIDISPIEKARKTEFLWGRAKTEFLKRVSHDIRNPLNGILNMVDLLEAEAGAGGCDKEKVELIRSCCEDILVVVDDIIDFSGFETEKAIMEEIPFDLREEINMAAGSLSNKSMRKKIPIRIMIDESIPKSLIGDPFHIRQVISKLLSNSLKYTKKGEIRLTVRPHKELEGNLMLSFMIEDTGSGIPARLLNKLNGQNATELLSEGSPGLSRTRQLIGLMKGEMQIESPLNPGKTDMAGTRVSFTLLVYSNDMPGKKFDFEHINTAGDIRALVLAGEFKRKPGIQGILKKLGIPCETTIFNESTAELIKSRAEDPAHSWSVIFIVDSPESNGFAIARSLHENNIGHGHLIVLISSVNKTGNIIKSRRLGIDHYLIEPCGTAEITDIINARFRHVDIGSSPKNPSGGIGNDLKILVAEDNASNQVVARSLFKRLGYDIDIAANGKEVLREN